MRRFTTNTRASEGVAIGRAFLPRRRTEVTALHCGTASEHRAAFERALSDSVTQISALAVDDAIFAAHLEMIDDPMLRESVTTYIEQGESAIDAVGKAQSDIVAMFETIDDEYLSSRATDVRDIFGRIVANLGGGPFNPFDGIERGDIVVDEELLPSDMAMLNLDMIGGFVMQKGSQTSHVCIIARNHSLPAVVAVSEVEEIESGDMLIVDGEAGVVIVNPDDATIDQYRQKQSEWQIRCEREQAMADVAVFDGEHRRIWVNANAGSVEEVAVAIDKGADGIGLFRSEFLYMHTLSEPTEQQQYEAYVAAAKVCGDRPLTIRTLDIGGDKALPYLPIAHEENPFLGWRAIRISLDRRDMFCRQLRAILRASSEGNVRLMFPMIASVAELREAKSLVEQCKQDLVESAVPFNPNIKIGVMIETPAAVFIARQLAMECDFFSIGTNDLTQYVMATDRSNAKVASLYNPYSEAVVEAVRMTIAVAKEAGIECGMCGEFASDADAAELLVGLGLREFSVNIGSIGKIRSRLAGLFRS